MRLLIGVVMLGLCPILPVVCQDLVAVAPQAAKVEYEDAHIRVVRLHIAPAATLPMHDRPARVVIPLTANDVTATRPDGAASHVSAPAGKASWSEPARRSITNLGGPLENIVVELKNAAGPASPLAQRSSPLPAGYLDERFHHWQFENQYVRVYDVRIPPGATTDFHVHAFDTVFVQVSGGVTSAQSPGKEWERAQKTVPGTVGFSADANHPRTHRVRNHGPAEYHVIAVQLLP